MGYINRNTESVINNAIKMFPVILITGVLEPSPYYCRDKDGKEADMLIEQSGTLYPVEIRQTSNPGKEHIDNFPALEKIKGLTVGPGVLFVL